ncbi:unnamed protein product [Schistosoma curassoni]|uniref:Retrotransposon protein n=1 Tax=Schistosoma curassoni TaxID=6186 RepID=A0A183KTY9_9TREM|nr:unnamed protein product [Schistosoma curassoni]
MHKGKSKILLYNTACTNPITTDEDLEDIKSFTYLSSIIDEYSGSDADVDERNGPRMKSSGPKEERKSKEQITSRNGDRHEKNEQELYRTRREGSGQSGLENSGRWLMLH